MESLAARSKPARVMEPKIFDPAPRIPSGCMQEGTVCHYPSVFGEIGAWKLDEIGWMQPQKVMASVDELIGMFLPSAFLGG